VPGGTWTATMLKSIRMMPVPHPKSGAVATIHDVMSSESDVTGALVTSSYQGALSGRYRPLAWVAGAAAPDAPPVLPLPDPPPDDDDPPDDAPLPPDVLPPPDAFPLLPLLPPLPPPPLEEPLSPVSRPLHPNETIPPASTTATAKRALT
jgi:hypothetical protein